MKEIRVANVGVMTSTGVIYGTSNACPRAVFFRVNVGDLPVGPDSDMTFGIGHTHEDIVVNNFLAKGYELEKEKDVTLQITSEVRLRGHIDIYRADINCVYELKSVTSTDSFKKIWFYNTPKPENVIQCCTYMIMTETENGVLRYGSFLWHKFFDLEDKTLDYLRNYQQYGVEVKKDWKTKKECVAIRPTYKEFKIKFDEKGHIFINDKKFQYSAKDIERYYIEIADNLERGILGPQPENLDKQPGGFSFSPCFSCEWKSICDRYNEGLYNTIEDIISSAKQHLETLQEKYLKQRIDF